MKKKEIISSEKIVSSLHTMLQNAQIDNDIWVAMRNARANQYSSLKLQRYGLFYISAENAFFNSLVIILYKVFEKRSDTVNFNKLRKTLSSDNPQILIEVDKKLSAIKVIWVKICRIRNEVIGHQTLESSLEESYAKADLSFNDIQLMLKECQELLFLIASKFHDVHIVFNLNGTHSFQNLVADLSDLHKLNSKNITP